MLYRRKYLLALKQEFGGNLDELRLQKLLLIATRKQEKKSYDFVPYKYGCYSFQAAQDLSALHKTGIVDKRDKSWIVMDKESYFPQLVKQDQASIKSTARDHIHSSNDELLKFTYLNYPFYATNSKLLDKVLEPYQINKITKQKRSYTDSAFFTIGYEGISIEKYLNKLLINDVRLLVDVRKNPLSMKYGFSKNQLRNSCQGVGINYWHIPDLGIDSKERKNLNTVSDYKILFDRYRRTTIKKNKKSLEQLKQLLLENKRIAITCFEKDVRFCHRGEITKTLRKQKDWCTTIKNI